jgi:hypothetical protein
MKRSNNMRKKIILFVTIAAAVLLSDWAKAASRGGNPTRSTRPTREYRGKDRRGDRPESDTAAAASADINSKLQIILNMANEGGRLEPKEIDIAKKSLRENRKFLRDFTDAEQGEYYLLNAWINYFAGYPRRALGEANKACKANPEDGDARATQIALSMLNNEFQIVSELTKERQEITIFGAEETQGTAQESHIGRMLDFNLDFIKGSVLGNKISNMELTCLNGSSLSYEPDKEAICLVIWKTGPGESTETPARAEPFIPMDTGGSSRGGPGGGRRGGRGGTGRTVVDASEQMLAFSGLFLAHYGNPQIRFVGVNTDSIEDKTKVMEVLLENPWPWAQAMAAEPANKAVSLFSEMNTQQPTLVIVQPGGTVFYAGPASGFIPRMLLSHLNETVKMQKTDDSSSDSGNNSTSINTRSSASKKQLKNSKDDEISAWSEDEEEQINPHADSLYQMALVHKKSGKILGYGRMVEYCRQIQELYPGSSQAEGAKELLRELPEKEQKKYNITNEEMGL